MERRSFLRGAALASLAAAAAPLAPLCMGRESAGYSAAYTLTGNLGEQGHARYVVDRFGRVDPDLTGLFSPDKTYFVSLADIRRIARENTLGAEYEGGRFLAVLVHRPGEFVSEWHDMEDPDGWYYKIIAPSSARYITVEPRHDFKPYVYRLPPTHGFGILPHGTHSWSHMARDWHPDSSEVEVYQFWHQTERTREQARAFLRSHVNG